MSVFVHLYPYSFLLTKHIWTSLKYNKYTEEP